MLWQIVFLSGDPRRVEIVTGDLRHVRAIDDQFLLGDPDGQQFANALPVNRVEVLEIGDPAFTVHLPVRSLGRIVGVHRQGQQVRLLFLVQIEWPTLGFFVVAQVGSVGQPGGGHFVEVFERSKGTAVEQVFFYVSEGSLHFTFRLGMPATASPWLEAVVRGERQEMRVVNRLFPVVARYHHLHVVVQAGSCQAREMFEGPDVFPDGGGKVLCLDEAHILASGIGQDVAEGMHAASSLGGEGDVVRGIIHLRLHSGSGFESLHRRLVRSRPERPQAVAHDGVAAGKSLIAQLLMEPHGGQVGVAFEQLCHGLLERIQQAGPPRWLRLRHTRSVIFMICQYLSDRLSVDTQHPGDAATGSAPIEQPDDLVARFLGRGLSNSLIRSRLRAATDPASCASFRKRGDKIMRSPGVSPVRPWCASHTSMRPSRSSKTPTRFHTWFPASLNRGSRVASTPPFNCASASRGFSRMYSCWLRPGHSSNRSTTPVSSVPDSASRRMSSRTSGWLPCGNRTSCRAAVDDKSPRRSSSCDAGPRRSSSASRRHTQLLWRPNSSATSTWLSPSSRTSACTIQASSSSRVRLPARFSP